VRDVILAGVESRSAAMSSGWKEEDLVSMHEGAVVGVGEVAVAAAFFRSRTARAAADVRRSLVDLTSNLLRRGGCTGFFGSVSGGGCVMGAEWVSASGSCGVFGWSSEEWFDGDGDWWEIVGAGGCVVRGGRVCSVF